MANPNRPVEIAREVASTFVSSAGWKDFVESAREDIIAPLRNKALKNPQLDAREHTGVVRALEAVERLIMLPYERLASASGKPVQEVTPADILRLFE